MFFQTVLLLNFGCLLDREQIIQKQKKLEHWETWTNFMMKSLRTTMKGDLSQTGVNFAHKISNFSEGKQFINQLSKSLK